MQLYLNNKIMSVLLDSKCGEHSARMTAMTAAADSTKSLISELDLKLNRAPGRDHDRDIRDRRRCIRA